MTTRLNNRYSMTFGAFDAKNLNHSNFLFKSNNFTLSVSHRDLLFLTKQQSFSKKGVGNRQTQKKHLKKVPIRFLKLDRSQIKKKLWYFVERYNKFPKKYLFLLKEFLSVNE
jgi:hypothetical protein